MENNSAVNRNKLLIHPNITEPGEHYSEWGEKDRCKRPHIVCVLLYEVLKQTKLIFGER